ncbi:hypothetical protein PR202_ga16368 [Eleusine coracana subsp. coracana]|uniref:Late embryogenesis abundant protein LEA-2 subgroup domain-containing protein n=1 Tax=Eleusine coracana subsp. coracana TaxID=191504 RepID=A0AAV5CMK2_ELECO|nr:hypothetical protein PR202_ga16368 [Eleusine coracana subsp. coracana]
MMMRRVRNEAAGFCLLCGIVLAVVLVAAYAVVYPVVVTVDSAALGRLTLAAAPAPGNSTAPSSLLAFNISLAVAVRNPNWAMSAWLVAPPIGELRFRGVPFAWGSLPPPPGTGRRGRNRIRARRTEVYRVSSTAQGVPMAALGSDGVAEFSRESAAGVFELELVVIGKVRYQAHPHRRRFFKVSCPLNLSLPTPPTMFARVTCT